MDDRTDGLETPRRIEVVPLDSIVGTLEPTVHFDARFRPTSELVRPRWERIALAHRTGHPLPPIDLVKRPDGYYVLDGRHRVSVAVALGLPDIEAVVREQAQTAGGLVLAANGRAAAVRGRTAAAPQHQRRILHPRSRHPETERPQRACTACA